MSIEYRYKTLIARIKRANDARKKTSIWQDADLSRPEGEQVVREMILLLPAGYYKIHDRQYGANLVDVVYDAYGWMPSMLVSESMLLGLQALYPERVYASFTHGLDAVEIKSPKKRGVSGTDDYRPRKVAGRVRNVTRKVRKDSGRRVGKTESQLGGLRG